MKISNQNLLKNTAYSLMLFSMMSLTSCEKIESNSDVSSELKLSTKSVELDISSASADNEHSRYPASNAIDGDNSYSSRWAGYGDPSNITLDLGSVNSIDYINIAFAKGDERIATFKVYVATSSDSYTQINSKTSSGTTSDFETFDLSNSEARYIKLECFGTDADDWNNIKEIEVYGTTGDGDGDGGTDLTYEYVLAATGQVDAYDADGEVVTGLTSSDDLYGQDAHYLKGETMAYTDNGDGSVTDNNTGLMWEQTPSSDTYTWEEAVTYCENLELNGYDDWRMPSLKELFSISDFSEGWPYIDQDFFDLASGEITKDEQFWSSNYYVGVTVEGGSESAFGVNHVTGHIKAYSANATGPVGGKYVRAVRGDEYGINDYVDNGNSTITDNSTGLMWSQDDNGEGIDWAAALAYAEASELSGYDDWRLPNIKELQSIVDYSRSITATDEANVGPAIDELFNCTQITSEAGYDDYAYYWSSTSAYFSTASPGYYYGWYVSIGRAVNDEGEDFHGAGAVRFDTKDEDGPAGEDAERYYNYVFLVRDAN